MPTTTQTVGQFVTNITALPYIRSQQIKVFVSGLRPNTRHYAYFDRVGVNDFCAPATVISTTPVTQDGFTITDARGSNLVSNNKGELCFVFDLPANTFYVGEREVFVCDIDVLGNPLAITSSATAKFNAYTYGIDSSSLSVSTVTSSTTSTTSTTATTSTTTATGTTPGTTTTTETTTTTFDTTVWESTAGVGDSPGGTSPGDGPF